METQNRFAPTRKQLGALGACAALVTSLVLAPQQPAGAGAVGGPRIYLNQEVLEDDSESYRVRFRGGELAQVVAVGDGDIDLYIYDAAGRLVAKDDAYDHVPVCQFRPSRTGSYTIVVENAASYHVDFDLETN